MDKRFVLLLAGLICVFSFFSACGSGVEPEPVQPEGSGPWNVESAEEASEVAGYRIAFPAFIPEGFERGKNIMVTQLGVPGLTNPANLPRTVEIVWAWIEDDSVKFVLTQSAKKFSVGNTEPAEICGVTGEKGLMEAVPDRMPARLVLGWSDGNLYYSLYGTLAGPLDEEILTQIACSVAVK